MKIRIITLAVFLGLFSTAIAGKKGKKDKKKTKTETKSMELKNELDSLSYALGISIANNLKSQGVDNINSAAMSAAVKDVYAGNDSIMKTDDANEFINSYFAGAAEKKSGEAQVEGKKFLAENATKDGVIVLTSGLQYKVIKMGEGPKPSKDDKVTTHYHGMLMDGTVFDSSVDRGEPATFPVGGVIPGWVEALQLMPVGSKWKLFIPSELAYGDRGAGPKIGPGATLVFEVELLSIAK